MLTSAIEQIDCIGSEAFGFELLRIGGYYLHIAEKSVTYYSMNRQMASCEVTLKANCSQVSLSEQEFTDYPVEMVNNPNYFLLKVITSSITFKQHQNLYTGGLQAIISYTHP